MLLLNDSLYHQKRKGSKYFYLLPFLMFKKERRGKTFTSGLPKKEMKKEILCNDYEVKNGKALVFEINGKDHNVTVKDLETDGAEFRIEAPRAIYCSAKFFHFGKHLDQITPDRTFPNYWENTEKLKYPANEIGYCRADHDGYRWWSKWFKVNGNADDPSEIDTIFDEIQDNIKNLHILHEFAKVHCADISNDESNGFLEGEQYDYPLYERREVMMTYKSEAEITAAFINDGWSKNTAFTELSFDDARKIGKYFVDLMLKGTKLFRMNICGNVYDDTGKLLLFDIASTSEAKRLIETYCENEFQGPADFSDIRNIGLAYTTITEEEIEIQVNANLEDSSIDTYLDSILIRKSAHPSIADLVKEELSSLSFDSLIEYSDQEIEEYKRIRNGIPISTLNKYYCDHFFDNIYRWEYFDFDGGKLDLMPSDREKYNVYKILDSSEKSLVNRLLVSRVRR